MYHLPEWMLQCYIVDTGTLTISLPFSGVGGDIYEFRDAQRVELRRKNNFNLQLGIYCCDIPTVAVHHYTDISVRDKPVYIYMVSMMTMEV